MITNTTGNSTGTGRQTTGGGTILLVSLLLALFSFISCSGVMDDPGQPQTLPENCGSFTLDLGGTERTILPDSLTLNSFAQIRLDFTPDTSVVGNTAVPLNVDKDNYGVTNGQIFILVAGTYNLTVRAYLDDAKSKLAAQSTAETIIISAGQNTSKSITLSPLLSSATEKGSFSWNITLPAGGSVTVETATMTIKNSSGVTQGAVVDLTTIPSSGTRIGLTPGVYTVLFDIKGKEGTNILRSIVWNELMYVYGNLEGNFTKTFTDDDFHRTQWNITFVYDNGGPFETPAPTALGSATQSVVHGGFILDEPVVRPGYLFGGWFTESSCTNEWVLASTPVHKDMTLYAKWTANTAVITLEVEEIVHGLSDESFTTPITVVRKAGHANEEYEVEVTGTYDSIKWEIDPVGVSTNTAVTGTGSKFTLSGTNTNYNTLGGHVLELTVTVGGNEYKMNIPFIVADPAAP